MKPTCTTIEPFLYLCRDGELSPAEQSIVTTHLAECPECRETLADLQSIETALAIDRAEVPEMAAGTDLASNVIARLNRRPVRRSNSFISFFSPEILFRRARPALSFALLAFAILFLTQEYRDATQVSELEQRLGREGTAVRGDRCGLLFDRNLYPGLSLHRDQATVDPLRLLSGSVNSLLAKRKGLFEELAGRYPNLSRITIEDGLDEREKAVLETEGKAFLKEFEQLVREGAK